MVSIIMPVYNSENYLRESIDSILNQTFTDFEFLIIDDCSNDKSWEILKSYSDRRIKLFRNNKNLGASLTRNRGFKLSRGKYIALMDADDLSLPSRLNHQVAFMEKEPEVGLCGTWSKAFGVETRTMRYPLKNNHIRIGLLFNNCFINTSVILRNAFLKDYNLYFKPNIEPSEDYELWVRCSRFFNLANIPRVLVHYRVHEEQASKKRREKQDRVTKIIKKAQVKELGLDASMEELSFFDGYSWQNYNDKKDYLLRIETWFFKLIDMNNQFKKYPDQSFKIYLATKFVVSHYYVNEKSFLICGLISRSIISDLSFIRWQKRLIFRLCGLVGVFYFLTGSLFAKFNN